MVRTYTARPVVRRREQDSQARARMTSSPSALDHLAAAPRGTPAKSRDLSEEQKDKISVRPTGVSQTKQSRQPTFNLTKWQKKPYHLSGRGSGNILLS